MAKRRKDNIAFSVTREQLKQLRHLGEDDATVHQTAQRFLVSLLAVLAREETTEQRTSSIASLVAELEGSDE